MIAALLPMFVACFHSKMIAFFVVVLLLAFLRTLDPKLSSKVEIYLSAGENDKAPLCAFTSRSVMYVRSCPEKPSSLFPIPPARSTKDASKLILLSDSSRARWLASFHFSRFGGAARHNPFTSLFAWYVGATCLFLHLHYA